MTYSDLDKILSKRDEFVSLSKLHKKRLIKLIIGVMNGDYKHRSFFPTHEIGSSSLHSTYLWKRFRKNGDGGYYKKVIEPYLTCINDSYEFGRGSNGYTKKYRLKEWVYDECIRHYKYHSKPNELSIIGKTIEPILEEPKSMVNDYDINGNPKSSKIQINPLVKPNFKSLVETIEIIENHKSNNIRKHIRNENVFRLQQWKKILNNKRFPMSVLQLYQESINGRLCPMTNLDFPHLINTPNRIRRVLFSDMDLMDYDMSNSHLSIFNGLCKKYGFDCQIMNEYLDNKSYYRNKWNTDFCVKVKLIKQYILSWLYGNDMNQVSKNPFYRDLGYDRMVKIKNDRMLVGIYKEILKGRKIIIDNQPIVNGEIINVMKKKYPSNRPKGKTLCFILFGYESRILEIVNEQIGDSMKVLIYDGWIGEKTNTKDLEKTIKQRLDIDIRFDEEPITLPSPNIFY